MRYHVEAFRAHGEMIYADNRDAGVRVLLATLITYHSPQMRVAIYASGDACYDTRDDRASFWKDYAVLQQGTWDELYPIFEAYARML